LEYSHPDWQLPVLLKRWNGFNGTSVRGVYLNLFVRVFKGEVGCALLVFSGGKMNKACTGIAFWVSSYTEFPVFDLAGF
jgi:hypothetical protein